MGVGKESSILDLPCCVLEPTVAIGQFGRQHITFNQEIADISSLAWIKLCRILGSKRNSSPNSSEWKLVLPRLCSVPR